MSTLEQDTCIAGHIDNATLTSAYKWQEGLAHVEWTEEVNSHLSLYVIQGHDLYVANETDTRIVDHCP